VIVACARLRILSPYWFFVVSALIAAAFGWIGLWWLFNRSQREKVVIDSVARKVLVPSRDILLGFDEVSAVCAETHAVGHDGKDRKRRDLYCQLGLLVSRSANTVILLGDEAEIRGGNPGLLYLRVREMRKIVEQSSLIEEGFKARLNRIEACLRPYLLVIADNKDEKEILRLSELVARMMLVPRLHATGNGVSIRELQ